LTISTKLSSNKSDAMTPARQILIVSFLLVVAAVLQGRLAHAVMIMGAQPDFPLVLLGCAALLIGGDGAIWLAFWTGLLQAAMAAQYVGSYLTSRVLAGAFASSLQRDLIRDSIVVPPLVVLAVTVITEFIFAAMVPHAWLHHLRPWLRGEIGGTVYNTVLSYPCFLLLRRCGIGYRREDPFGG
jgi:rod shape-determining protein MreD